MEDQPRYILAKSFVNDILAICTLSSPVKARQSPSISTKVMINTISFRQVKVTENVFMSMGSGVRLLALNSGSSIYWLCELEKNTTFFCFIFFQLENGS